MPVVQEDPEEDLRVPDLAVVLQHRMELVLFAEGDSLVVKTAVVDMAGLAEDQECNICQGPAEAVRLEADIHHHNQDGHIDRQAGTVSSKRREDFRSLDMT